MDMGKSIFTSNIYLIISIVIGAISLFVYLVLLLIRSERKKKEIENQVKELETKLNEYVNKFANPYIAAERGFIDDVILPRDTKCKIVNAFRLLKTKVDKNPKKKHGNIPL